MKFNDLITVIFPVYNVEKFLKNSLNSILNQTYKNLEIIVVDDGSTDKSGQICDDYEKKFKKIIKVYHKSNGGLADARNYGLQKATGKYICFVDSDDIIHNKMIETLYNSIIVDHTQIAVCNFKNINENYNLSHFNKKIEIKNKYIYSKEDSLKAMVNLNIGFAPNVCTKLLERKLFTKDCYFPKGRLYEDMIVTTKILNKIKNVSYLDCELYFYLQRRNSITQKFNIKEYDHIEMSKQVLIYIKENCKNVESYFITYHSINCISVINKMIKNKVLNIVK